MANVHTMTATAFKAKCLDILDRLADHTLEQVVVTKRGRPVAVLTPPMADAAALEGLHGFMRGTVIVPEGLDLTAPACDEPFDAERDILHR